MNADFELYDFGRNKFDLIYSGAAFQWIKEETGYPKVLDMLKNGGAFATFGTGRSPKNDEYPIHAKIQEVYAEYFRPAPETNYVEYMKQKNERLQSYQEKWKRDKILEKYGFSDIEYRCYETTREFTAVEYVSHSKTHADHISLQEPYKSKFFNGIRDVVLSFGDKITLYDSISLYLARKP